MGLFDDLIPGAAPAVTAPRSGGLFDDLIPQPGPSAMTEPPGLGDMLIEALSPPAVTDLQQPIPPYVGMPRAPAAVDDTSPTYRPLADPMQEAIRLSRPQPGPVDIPQSRVAEPLEDSFGGDWRAGMIQLGLLPEGMTVGGGAKQFQRAQDINEGISLARELGFDIPEADLADAASRQGALVERGAEMVSGVMPEILQRNAEIGQIPLNPAAREAMNAETFGGAVAAASEDPLGVARTFGVRSLPVSLPTMVAAILGSAGGPGGAAAAAGAASAGTEYAANITGEVEDILRGQGVDPADPAALEAFLTANPGALEQMVRDTATRSVIIGGFDALSGGVTGKLAQWASKGGLGRHAAAAAGATVADPVLGAAGEAAAGGTPGDVLAEAIGGLAIGGPTELGQAAVEVAKGRQAPTVTPGAPPPPPAAPDVSSTQNQQNGFAASSSPPETIADLIVQALGLEPPSPPPPDLVPPVLPSEPALPTGARTPAVLTPITPPGEETPPEDTAPVLPTEKVAEPPLPQKRPFTTLLRRAGIQIDPQAPAGRELASMGITPRSHPGLFKRGGSTDLDNIVASEHPELQAIIGQDDATGYFTPQSIIQGLDDEMRGNPPRGAEQQAIAQARADWEDMQSAVRQEWAAQQMEQPATMRPGWDFAPPDMDMEPDRIGRIGQAVDGALVGVQNLDPETRSRIIDTLDREGGSVEMAVELEIIRSVLNAETGEDVTVTQAPTIPFDGEEGATAGEGVGDPDAARRERVSAQAGADGAGATGLAGADAAYREAYRAYQDAGDAFKAGRIDDDEYFSIRASFEAASKALDDAEKAAAKQPARTGTEEGGKVDLTPEGKQLVIPGAEKITDKQRAERQQQQAKRGGNAPPPDDGLFGDPGNRVDLFDQPKQSAPTESAPSVTSPPPQTGAAGAPTETPRSPAAAPPSPPEPKAEAPSEDVPTFSEFRASLPEDEDGNPDFEGEGMRRTGGKPWSKLTDDEKRAAMKAAPAKKKPTTTQKEEDAGDTTGRKPKGRLSPKFLDFSFTNRASVYGAAFRAAGIDPGEANSLPVEKQISLLQQVLKDKFGINVELPTITVRKKNIVGRIVRRSRRDITAIEAVDQMLDAFRNLQMLANILGVPEKALALELDGKPITLSLVSVRRLGALGMFEWGGGKRVIHLPGRSNSFAHEWGHALDHYLTQVAKRDGKYDRFMFDEKLADEEGLLSRLIDEKGLTPKRSLTEALIKVMQAIYGDKAKMSQLVLDLQQQAAEVDADGNPTPAAKKAMEVMKGITDGKRPPAAVLSRYFATSKQYDDVYNGGSGYFTDPAEMFARAMESWVGRTVSAISDLPLGFLSKGEWAYNNDSDPRLELTFPKGTDVVALNEAIQELGHALTRSGLVGLDPAATRPEDLDIISDKNLLMRMPKMGTMEKALGAQKAELRETVAAWRRFFNLRDKAGMVGKMASGVWQDYLNSLTASMIAAANRHKKDHPKAYRALLNIADMIGSDPGSGRLAKRVYQQDMETQAKRRLRMVDGALAKAGFRHKQMTDAEAKTLRSLLIGEKGIHTTQEMRTLASDLRQILKGIWYDLKAAGINVGYADSYLPRIPNKAEITKDPAAFRRDAAKVYGLMFEKEVTDNEDPETQLADMKTVIRGLRNATKPTPEGDRVPSPRLTEDDEELISNWHKARANLNRLIKQAEKDPLNTKIGDKIADAEAKYERLHEQVLEMLEERFADYSAENWHTSMMVGDSNDFDTMGPTGSFLKGRILSQEADKILTRWLENDPLDLISGYAFAAARRAEYAKRFGVHGEKLENMLQAAVKDGATGDDVGLMRRAVNSATGRFRHPSQAGAQLSSALTFWGTIAMLGRATFASLSEPVVTGLRTGDVRDSARAIISQVRTLASGSRREDLFELARVIGLVTSSMRETVMANRIGADSAAMTKGMSATMGKFFQKSLLTPLTSFQMASTMPVAHAVIMRHLRTDAGTGRGKALANAELNELGIAKADRKELLDWLEGLNGMPTPEDLLAPDGSFYNPAADLWATSVVRLVNTVIQNPQKSDRPIMANHPMVAALYGIMSFTIAFHRNILVRNVRRVAKADGFGNKGLLAAHAAAGVATLLAGQFLATVIREAIFNPEKWKEKEDEDELMSWLMQRAFSRSGLTGMFDPLVQLLTGIKYERDLTSVAAGPYAAYFLYNLQRVLAAWAGRNSPETNTAENNAVRAGYQMLFQPALMAAAANLLPGGPLLGGLSTAAIWWGSSPQAAAEFANWATDLKGTDYRDAGKSRPWWEIAPAKDEE